MPLSELVSALVPTPHYKLASTAHTVFNTSSWQQGLEKITPKSFPPSTRAVSLLQVARGSACDIRHLMRDIDSIDQRLLQLYRPTSWRPIEHWYSRGASGNKSLSLLANSNVVNNMLCNVNRKSEAMFLTNAYTHWLLRQGCERQQFVSAFDTLKTIMESYESV